MNLIFIGDEFYHESGTIMSSLCHEDGRRSDWGKVNVALRNGESVNIRPATNEEIGLAHKQLSVIKKKHDW